MPVSGVGPNGSSNRPHVVRRIWDAGRTSQFVSFSEPWEYVPLDLNRLRDQSDWARLDRPADFHRSSDLMDCQLACHTLFHPRQHRRLKADLRLRLGRSASVPLCYQPQQDRLAAKAMGRTVDFQLSLDRKGFLPGSRQSLPRALVSVPPQQQNVHMYAFSTPQ